MCMCVCVCEWFCLCCVKMHTENYLEDVWLNVLKIHDFTLSFVCAPADDDNSNNNNNNHNKDGITHVSRMNGLQKINQGSKQASQAVLEILY